MTAGAPALLQRDTELRLIGEWLDDAVAGSGRVALVLAGAGLGKTSVLREAGTLGRARSMTVLAARGGELEREIGFGMARQLFEGPLRALEGEDRAAVVTGAAEAALPAVSGGGGESAGDP